MHDYKRQTATGNNSLWLSATMLQKLFILVTQCFTHMYIIKEIYCQCSWYRSLTLCPNFRQYYCQSSTACERTIQWMFYNKLTLPSMELSITHHYPLVLLMGLIPIIQTLQPICTIRIRFRVAQEDFIYREKTRILSACHSFTWMEETSLNNPDYMYALGVGSHYCNYINRLPRVGHCF